MGRKEFTGELFAEAAVIKFLSRSALEDFACSPPWSSVRFIAPSTGRVALAQIARAAVAEVSTWVQLHFVRQRTRPLQD